MHTYLSLALIAIAIASACTALWSRTVAARAQRRFRAALDAAQAMFDGQLAAAWQEGYDQGVEDERTAAEYNAGTCEKVSPDRANPYAAPKKAAG